MAWRKEEWTRLVGKGKLLLRKSMRVLSLLAVPLKWAGEKYRRWPRLLQLGLIYLLVVILSAGSTCGAPPSCGRSIPTSRTSLILKSWMMKKFRVVVRKKPRSRKHRPSPLLVNLSRSPSPA